MERPADFEIAGRRGYYGLRGEYPFDEVVRLVANSVEFALEQKLNELLLQGRELILLAPLSIVDRYDFGKSIAELGAGQLRIAVVAHSELIDWQKFAVLVATNRGLDCNVFSNDQEAIAWLETPVNREA